MSLVEGVKSLLNSESPQTYNLSFAEVNSLTWCSCRVVITCKYLFDLFVLLKIWESNSSRRSKVNFSMAYTNFSFNTFPKAINISFIFELRKLLVRQSVWLPLSIDITCSDSFRKAFEIWLGSKIPFLTAFGFIWIVSYSRKGLESKLPQ